MFSIVIPTHNEAARIRATLKGLLGYLNSRYKGREFEVIIVDDGRDDTAVVAKKIAQGRHPVRVLHFNERLGKGGALNAGIAAANGKYVITYDADAATPPKEIPRMLEALKSADVVAGSRTADGARVLSYTPRRRRIASKAFNVLVNLLFGLGISDTQCGFKGITSAAARRLVPRLKLNGFEWDVEFLVKARQLGYSISELPIEWKNRKEGKIHSRDTLDMLRGVLSLKKEISFG